MNFKPPALVAAIACVIAIALVFLAQTPRARLNVMQFTGVGFVLIVAGRMLTGKRTPSPDQPANPLRLPFLGIAIGAAAWIPALATGFISDDFSLLYDAGQGSMLQQLWWLLRYGHAGTFLRPLGFASIYLDYALWGTSPMGYHVMNLLLHFASVAALYLLVRNLGVARDVSAVTAGIFAAMPVQAEAVVWMGARFDLLATSLTLWAVVSYLSFKRTRNPAAYGMVLLFYLLAMLSKETGFLLPLFLVAIEVLVLRSVQFRDLGGLFGLGALVFAYRWATLSGIGGYLSSGTASALSISPKTFEGLFIRSPSQLLPGLNWTQPPAYFVIGVGALTAAVLLMLALQARPSPESRALITLAGVWIFISILPAHFLLMVGPGLTNSRVLYMAGAGAAVLLGQLISSIPERRLQQTIFPALALLFSLGVYHNVGAWRWTSRLSAETLAEVVRLAPAPPPQTEFVIAGLPDTVRGVFLFHVSLTQGLKLLYNRDDISARRDTEPAALGGEGPRPRIHLLWKESSGRLLEIVERKD